MLFVCDREKEKMNKTRPQARLELDIGHPTIHFGMNIHWLIYISSLNVCRQQCLKTVRNRARLVCLCRLYVFVCCVVCCLCLCYCCGVISNYGMTEIEWEMVAGL